VPEEEVRLFALFTRSRRDTVQPGGEFEPRRIGMVRTTARVLNVVDDLHGIPHVTFELTVAPPSGTRTLSLERFTDLYPVAL
jgi:hypothetical protein